MGKLLYLDDYRPEPAERWAAWCVHCRQEIHGTLAHVTAWRDSHDAGHCPGVGLTSSAVDPNSVRRPRR